MPQQRHVAVVAIGGNSLIADAMHQSMPDQFEAVVDTARCIVDLIEDGWTVAVTHGNGPQVGFALRRSELSMPEVPPMSMDYADADTQGVIGYMIQRALGNEMARRGLRRDVLTVVTQVVVDAKDPEIGCPSKPIGSFLSEADARVVAERDGWAMAEDPAGRGWRRLAPSPRPKRIVELDPIRALIESGFVVVCCGGGGIPVTEDGGRLTGTRAVVDKDLTASMLAAELGADLFAISTDVERVAVGFGTARQAWLDRTSAAELLPLLEAGEFGEGTMAPKIRATVDFLRSGGSKAIITDPQHLAAAVRGEAGTTIVA